MKTKTNKVSQNKLSDLTAKTNASGGRARGQVAAACGYHLRRQQVSNIAFPPHLPQ
jgi:hypothetical protein